jgi:enamine deaminase RidA (YjgF/YER057c/UK114 family)
MMQHGMKGSVEYINPDSMVKSPAFSQAVVVAGPVKTVYVGAQNAVDGDRNIVGRGDIVAQTEQVLKNIGACLEAAGAGPEHVVSWNIYVMDGQEVGEAAAAGLRWLGNRPHPPANNVVFVTRFSPPDFLLSIDAVAVVPIDG